MPSSAEDVRAPPPASLLTEALQAVSGRCRRTIPILTADAAFEDYDVEVVSA